MIALVSPYSYDSTPKLSLTTAKGGYMLYIVRSNIDGEELYSSSNYVNCIHFIETECGDDYFIEQINLLGE